MAARALVTARALVPAVVAVQMPDARHRAADQRHRDKRRQ
jgi:hypothetical protein